MTSLDLTLQSGALKGSKTKIAENFCMNTHYIFKSYCYLCLEPKAGAGCSLSSLSDS